MNPSPILRAELTGLLLEGLLFGCFTILYPISLWMLVYKHRHRRQGYTNMGIWLFAMVTVMFLLALTHLVLVAENVIAAVADHGAVPNGTFLFLVSGHKDRTTMASIVILAVVSWVGDIFMTYRVFIVWGRSWKAIIPPSLLFAGTCVTTGLCVYAFQNTRLNVAEALYAKNVGALMTSYLTLVLAMNMTTLALILGRLIRHDRIIRTHRIAVDISGPTLHWRVARTIVQSEAMYSATILANLIFYVTHSAAFFVTSYMLPPLVGISFTLIITHTGFNEIMGQLEQGKIGQHSYDLEWVVHKSPKDSLSTIPSALVVSASGSS